MDLENVNRFLRFVLATGIALLFATLQLELHASDGLRTVALTGQSLPGLPAGLTFSGFESPDLNNSGHTAFRAPLAGVPVPNYTGVWSEGGDGQLKLIPRDVNTPVTGQFHSPVLNNAGRVGVSASTGGPRGGTESLWQEDSGILSRLAAAGQPAPGTAAGTNFFTLSASSLSNSALFNEDDDVGFIAGLSGGGATSANDSGIWVGGGSGPLALRIREGDPAPGTEQVFASFFDASGPVLNDAGSIAFTGTLTGPGTTTLNRRGVWSDRSGSLQLEFRGGNQASGTPVGVMYFDFLTRPYINNAGHISVAAGIVGTGVDATNNRGIWADRGIGVIELVARTGDHAPGTALGVNFAGPLTQMSMNSHGNIAFNTTLVGPNVLPSNDSGIWSEGRNKDLELVVREGQQAPGTSAGVTFSAFNFAGGTTLNGLGQVAFMALLTGPGVTATNDLGIWAQDIHGDLHLIVREGDMLDVSDDPLITDLRTVTSFTFEGRSGNEEGGRSGFNELGQIAFQALFVGGAQGVFVSSLVAVPEPSLVALIASLSLVGFSQRNVTRRRNEWNRTSKSCCSF